MRITISKDHALILLEGLRHLSIVSIPEGRNHDEYGTALKKLRSKLEPIAEPLAEKED